MIKQTPYSSITRKRKNRERWVSTGKQPVGLNAFTGALNMSAGNSIPPPTAVVVDNPPPPPPDTGVPARYADPRTNACPTYNHPDWPLLCPEPYTYEIMQSLAQPVIDEMNQYRQYRNLQPMVWNKNLTWAAQINSTFWYNNPSLPGSHHLTPGSPHGDTLPQRLAAANWIGGSYAEGLTGDINFDYPTNPQLPNLMTAFCRWKSEYTSDTTESAHMNPMVRTNDTAVASYNSVGIGWIWKLDANGDAQVNMVAVYGNTTTNNEANAPPLEDSYILCS
jgi:hypothetical protein